MEILEIKYKVRGSFGQVRSEGCIRLKIEGFFPCAKSKFKKLLQIIEMAAKKDEILKQLQLAFPERVKQLEIKEAEYMAIAKDYGKDFFSEMQEAADLKSQLKTGKYPNGVTIPVYLRANMKDSIKDHKERAKTAESYARENLNKAKACKKGQMQMQELISFLNEYLKLR